MGKSLLLTFGLTLLGEAIVIWTRTTAATGAIRASQVRPPAGGASQWLHEAAPVSEMTHPHRSHPPRLPHGASPMPWSATTGVTMSTTDTTAAASSNCSAMGSTAYHSWPGRT